LAKIELEQLNFAKIIHSSALARKMNKIHTLLYASKLLLIFQSHHLWAEKIEKNKIFAKIYPFISFGQKNG